MSSSTDEVTAPVGNEKRTATMFVDDEMLTSTYASVCVPVAPPTDVDVPGMLYVRRDSGTSDSPVTSHVG